MPATKTAIMASMAAQPVTSMAKSPMSTPTEVQISARKWRPSASRAWEPVSFATVNDVEQSDFFGLVSGTEVADKVARTGFTATKSANVDAPIINEYPLTLECRLIEMEEVPSHGNYYVIGEIVNMTASKAILDKDGNIDISKLQPIVYNSADKTYHSVGEKVGDAWKSGEKYMPAEKTEATVNE